MQQVNGLSIQKNNATTLDPYNRGGFTVFGEVIEDGMDVINAIAAVKRCNTGHAGFQELPMPDYSDEQCTSKDVPGVENFVTVHNVIVFDSTIKNRR